ncbi:filamentous hemagglutinin N-terminal domain-containing protein [Caldichromatium japonicum]|uniref:Filamentous hemagglutinin N-terminal domain-containing protein n=1 Tax=Caldichromatium japonicum TaxID=2699430 RepID=A0A6G7VBD6_9GAMM|nr:filamentous hemagglutinin N-terminal domain-containing protein [Caldichromatium japonicum]QIK37262.1 filamentous hemagglutinin N-terminal domain-containing protein [Caldichromatium japonicum]
MRGANLFHSFSRLDIGEGQRATFTGPEHIQNVIGRVTGGRVSRIDGTLRSQVGRADVYLINPAGVVLGPGAQVDVPAALYLSAADELRFSDGSRYSARDPQASTLSMAAPESFGFLSPQVAGLEIDGSRLVLNAGQRLSLTAGEIQLRGSSAEQPAVVRVPGGEIRVEAVGRGQRQVPVHGSGEAGTGRLVVENSWLDTSGEGGGQISLRAGELEARDSLLVAHNLGDRDVLVGQRSIDLRVAGSAALSGTEISAFSLGAGAVGAIDVEVGGRLELVEGSRIGSIAFDRGKAADVQVRAGAIRLFGGTERFTGIASYTESGSIGDAGLVRLEVEGLLEILNGAKIVTDTFGDGLAGNIDISAGSVTIDNLGNPNQVTLIASQAGEGSSGDAGRVTLNVEGLIEISNGAVISASTAGQGKAGKLFVTADVLRLDGSGISNLFTGITNQVLKDFSGEGGEINLNISDRLEVINGAMIGGFTLGNSRSGDVNIRAGSLLLDGYGNDLFTGITSYSASDAKGDAGKVKLEIASSIEVLRGAMISTSTWGSGNAGVITISAESIIMDGFNDPLYTTWISSQSEPGSTGNAGSIDIKVSKEIGLLNGAVISTGTRGEGNAGNLMITADKIQITGSPESELGTAIASESLPGSKGDAGFVWLNVAKSLEVLNGAFVSSSTASAGEGGGLFISAGSVYLDGLGKNVFTGLTSSSVYGSSGNAGNINLEVDGLLEIVNGAHISTSTWGIGNAGEITVRATHVRLDTKGDDQFTGLASRAGPGSFGHAGRVNLEVTNLLEILNGAKVSTSTAAVGNAGDLSMQADEIFIRGEDSGAASAAFTTARGQVGNLAVTAERITLADGGFLSISAEQASVDPSLTPKASRLQVAAQQLRLDGGFITAVSSGPVPAAAIDLEAQDLRLVNGSQITTESLQADAGSIVIGGGRLWVADSRITTSALGERGDGGDIVLRPEYLILEGGFIQANTAGLGARGGDIWVGSRALLGSEGRVEIGGQERASLIAGLGRNVIQAAAPGGEQGVITVVAPELDLTVALVPLATSFGGWGGLLTDPCQALAVGAGSSLVEGGSGGVAPTPAEPAALPLDRKRLERLGTSSNTSRQSLLANPLTPDLLWSGCRTAR